MNRWFLPQSPDLLGLLARQGEVTIRGMDALAAWSRGDHLQGATVLEVEHLADAASRDVLTALKDAFVTPISPEDIYEISERLDAVLNAAKDLVRESELVAMDPDAAMIEMADLAAAGVRHLVEGFPSLASHPDKATASADLCIDQQRSIEHVYRRAMSALLDVEDLREVTGRRELYRRCARMGDRIEGVAHRVWYAVVKET